MAERGAPPRVPAGRRRALALVRSFTSPLLPDDYLELVNPLWSTRELRGRIERIERETPSAVTVTIKPGWEWQGHRPGSISAWGSRWTGSITGAPTRSPPRQSGRTDASRSRRSSSRAARSRPSSSGVCVQGRSCDWGAWKAPSYCRIPATAAAVHQRRQRHHADHEHVAQPCGPQSDRGRRAHPLRALRRRSDLRARAGELRRPPPGLPAATATDGRAGSRDTWATRRSVPDWGSARRSCVGPPGCWRQWSSVGAKTASTSSCTSSTFSPSTTLARGARVGRQDPLLAERSGGLQRRRAADPRGRGGGGRGPAVRVSHGICHTCVGKLRAGQVRDLRTGLVHGQPGEMLRTCINAPEGAVEIDL